MMRRNAPFTAALALAALSLAAPSLEARTTPAHRRPVAQTQTPAPKKPSGKAAAKPRHHAPRKKRDTSDDSIPPTITRIHTQPGSRKPAGAKKPQAPAVHTTTAPTLPRPATSDDFVQAASGAPVTLSPSEPAPNSPAQDASPSQPVSVVVLSARSWIVLHCRLLKTTAATPVLLPSLYNRGGHLVVPWPMKGSHEILLRQNQVADREGLDRIRDDDDLLDLRYDKLLVAMPVTGPTLVVDERLPADRRYCRPWTARFLTTLSRAYYARFQTPLLRGQLSARPYCRVPAASAAQQRQRRSCRRRYRLAASHRPGRRSG